MSRPMETNGVCKCAGAAAVGWPRRVDLEINSVVVFGGGALRNRTSLTFLTVSIHSMPDI